MYQVTENSTVFGFKTPFGSKTPFRWPTKIRASLTSIMSGLAVSLYPTGLAFTFPKFGVGDKLHEAINVSFIRIINDCRSTLDSLIPDNENFNSDDCSLWEYRLGLRSNIYANIDDRRSAILRKMSRGRNVKARQSKDYLEYQLQTAGFNVFVHENGFLEGGVWVYKTPLDITGSALNLTQHANSVQHGLGLQHGEVSSQVIANSSKPNESFSVGFGNQWATFFIGGQVLGTTATIPANREIEFRELVLKLKPLHLVAYTFINFA